MNRTISKMKWFLVKKNIVISFLIIVALFFVVLLSFGVTLDNEVSSGCGAGNIEVEGDGNQNELNEASDEIGSIPVENITEKADLENGTNSDSNEELDEITIKGLKKIPTLPKKDPIAFPGNIEICNNNFDDNVNGEIDCAESTCLGFNIHPLKYSDSICTKDEKRHTCGAKSDPLGTVRDAGAFNVLCFKFFGIGRWLESNPDGISEMQGGGSYALLGHIIKVKNCNYISAFTTLTGFATVSSITHESWVGCNCNYGPGGVKANVGDVVAGRECSVEGTWDEKSTPPPPPSPPPLEIKPPAGCTLYLKGGVTEAEFYEYIGAHPDKTKLCEHDGVKDAQVPNSLWGKYSYKDGSSGLECTNYCMHVTYSSAGVTVQDLCLDNVCGD